MKILMRAWTVAMDPYAYDSSPLASAHAEQLLDIAVAGSVQSLQETRDALKKIEEQLMLLMSQTEEKHKGFRNRVDYRHKLEAFQEFLTIVVAEIKTYDQRIEANRRNDGRVE